jgi:uncharacterized protein DUF4262
MCNGATREEVFRALHVQIVDRGFAIVPVGTRIENKGWAYTIGLIESKDHPELVVAGYSGRSSCVPLYRDRGETCTRNTPAGRAHSLLALLLQECRSV